MLEKPTSNHTNLTGRRVVKALKAKADQRRTVTEKVADWIVAKTGSMLFLMLNVAFFVFWLSWNSGRLGVAVFDPYPYGMLTMVVSLEAIILAIFVLISQNRAAKLSELREEVDLQVDVITEREITKILHLVAMIAAKHNIDTKDDKELAEMIKNTDMAKIEKILEQQVGG